MKIQEKDTRLHFVDVPKNQYLCYIYESYASRQNRWTDLNEFRYGNRLVLAEVLRHKHKPRGAALKS